MHQWLYGKAGYYSSLKEIGKGGDFFTAVSTSQFFGGSIANYLVKQIEEGKRSKECFICEIGAHKGYLMADIVQFIYTLAPELLKSLRFGIVERFEHLQKAQAKYLQESFADVVNFEFYNSLDEVKEKDSFFIANEIFDAFACELLYKERFARLDEHGEVIFDVEDESLLAKAKKYHQEKGEIAVGYEAFASRLANASQHFEFITFDYGEKEARPDFSLRVYKEHKVFAFFDEALKKEQAFAKSDITYDVNFSHVIDAMQEAGINLQMYKSQALALIDFGMMELLTLLEKHVPQTVYKKELDKAKMLIDPSFMGERFKMLSFKK